MTTRILTLFGEEVLPDPPVVARGKRKSDSRKSKEEQSELVSEEEPVPQAEQGEAPPSSPIVASAPSKVKKPRASTPKRKKEALSEDAAPAETPVVLTDWQPEKQYYTIGEVARLFQVNISNIRFWTNEFKLKVRTTRKGDRLYSPDAIQELRMIYHLVKERGFTLSGAKVKLKDNKKAELKAISLKQSLQSLRHQLLEIRNQLV